MRLVAPTATLVARERTHPALVQLFVQAAQADPRRRRLVPPQGRVPERANSERRSRPRRSASTERPAAAAALPAVLARQPGRPHVGGAAVDRRRADPAVARGAAAVRVPRPLARLPLVRPAAPVEAAIGEPPADELLRELDAGEARRADHRAAELRRRAVRAAQPHRPGARRLRAGPALPIRPQPWTPERTDPCFARIPSRPAPARASSSAAASAGLARCARCRRPPSRSRSSTAPTTTCSSRCSTRSRRPGCRAGDIARADPPHPRAASATSRVLLGEVTAHRPRRRAQRRCSSGGERLPLRLPDRRHRRHATATSATTSGRAHAPGLKTLEDALEIRAPHPAAPSSAPSARPTPAQRARLADLRRRRRRPDRRRAGRHARRDRAPHAARRVPPHRPAAARASCWSRRRRACSAPSRQTLSAARARAARAGSASRCAPARRSPRIDADGVTNCATASTHRARARTVLWAAGVAGLAARRALPSTGAPLDRAGRVLVEPDLSVPGHPEIFVVGDLAAALSHGHGERRRRCPASPRPPSRWAHAAAANMLRRLRGEPTRPFRYRDYGNLATIGRKAAVVDLAVPASARWILRLLGLAVLAVRPHLLPDRLSQPPDRADRLGLGLFHATSATPASWPSLGATRCARPWHGGRTRHAAVRQRLTRARAGNRRHTDNTDGHPHLTDPPAPRRSCARRWPGAASHALLVPGSDPHLSEYLPERWQGRRVAVGLHRLDGHAGGRRPTAPRCLPTAATGCRPRPSWRAPASSWCSIPTGRVAGARRLAGRSSCRAAPSSRSTARCWAWPPRRRCGARSTPPASRCAPTSTCSTPSGPTAPRCRPQPVYEHRAPHAPRSARRQAGAGARGDGAARRDAPLRLHRRRHRLAHQPARQRRQLQPGVPGAPAAGRAAAARCSSAPARSTPRCAPSWPPTACDSRPTTRPRAALAALGAGDALLLDPKRVTLGLREQVGQRVPRGRGHQPEHAAEEPQDRGRGRASSARRWPRTARRCASSTPGSRPRWHAASASPS